MNIKQYWVCGLIGLLTGLAHGAFTSPTEAQLQAVAADPALAAALLDGASVAQTAGLVKDVIVQIVSLGLDPKERDARIAALVTSAFAALPGQTQALASALGSAVAAEAAALSPEVVSAIQVAVIATAGPDGASAGAAFGNSFTAGIGQGPGPASKGLAGPPPSPPVGKQYEGLAVP